MTRTHLSSATAAILSIATVCGSGSAAQVSNDVPAMASVADGYKISSDGKGPYVDGMANVRCVFFRGSGDFVLDTSTAHVLRRFSISLDVPASPLTDQCPDPGAGPVYYLLEAARLQVGAIFDMYPGEVRAAAAGLTQFSVGGLKFGKYQQLPDSNDWCTDWLAVSASYDPGSTAVGPGGANTWVISTTAGTATSWNGPKETGSAAVLLQSQPGQKSSTQRYYQIPLRVTVRLK